MLSFVKHWIVRHKSLLLSSMTSYSNELSIENLLFHVKSWWSKYSLFWRVFSTAIQQLLAVTFWMFPCTNVFSLLACTFEVFYLNTHVYQTQLNYKVGPSQDFHFSKLNFLKKGWRNLKSDFRFITLVKKSFRKKSKWLPWGEFMGG